MRYAVTGIYTNTPEPETDTTTVICADADEAQRVADGMFVDALITPIRFEYTT